MDNLHIIKDYLLAIDRKEKESVFIFPDIKITKMNQLVTDILPLFKYKVFSFAKEIYSADFSENKLEMCSTYLERYCIGRNDHSFGFCDILDVSFNQTVNILKSHPLPDGNKRLAFQSGIYLSFLLVDKEESIIMNEQDQIILASAGFNYLEKGRELKYLEFQIVWNTIMRYTLLKVLL